MRLEGCADPTVASSYPFAIDRVDGVLLADPSPVLRAIWKDFRSGAAVSTIAGAFHNAVAGMTVDLCKAIRDDTGITRVCLSGGCFQNALLAERTKAGLERADFQVHMQRLVPPNDGGLALGQAVVAYARTAARGN